MEDVVYEFYDEFVDMMESNSYDRYRSNNFMDTYDFEDDYSHNEIGNAQTKLHRLMKIYLHENHSGKFGMHVDWCVHFYTVEFLKEKELSEIYIIY